MPFVKITTTTDTTTGVRYINTDHIVIGNPEQYQIQVRIFGGEVLDLTPESFNYLFTCVDLQAAMLATKLEPLSLQSRIAQALRYDFPQGATSTKLIVFLRVTDSADFQDALTILHSENVIIQTGDFYRHASNSKPSPDPSVSDAER